MFNKQRLTNFRSSLAIAAIAVGLVAAQSAPAAAHIMHPDRVVHEQEQLHRNVDYAPVHPALTFTDSVPPDYCDLPSAGCQSYLSN